MSSVARLLAALLVVAAFCVDLTTQAQLNDYDYTTVHPYYDYYYNGYQGDFAAEEQQQRLQPEVPAYDNYDATTSRAYFEYYDYYNDQEVAQEGVIEAESGEGQEREDNQGRTIAGSAEPAKY